MAETLILRFIDGEDQVDWIVLDDAGDVVMDRRGALEDITPLAQERRVNVIVPAASVLRVAAKIPLKGTAKIRQVLPFALEEQIAGDIDAQHFAFSKADSAGSIPVAVVADKLMQAWTDRLAAAGIRADGIYAASDGVPGAPATISMLIDGDNTVIRDQLHEFTVTDTASMPMMLEMLLDQHSATMENDATAVPVSLLVYCDEATHAQYEDLWGRLRMRTDTVEAKIFNDGALAFAGTQLSHHGGVNLLQGDYTPKSELNIEWGPWQLPAALTAAFVVALLLFQGASWWQLSREEAALDAAALQLLQTTFPDNGETTDPWAALEQSLGNQGGDATWAGGPGFAEAMSVLAAAIAKTPDIKMQTLGYRTGTVDLQLLAPSVDVLDKLRQEISDGGQFSAEIQSANPDKEVIKGRMQITVASQ